MPLPIGPPTSAGFGSGSVERPSGDSPLGRMLESAGQSTLGLGIEMQKANQKRKLLESELRVNDRETQAVLDMDAFHDRLKADPTFGSGLDGTQKPIDAFGTYYQQRQKDWYKGLTDIESAQLDKKLLIKSLEYKTKAQGLTDGYLVDYAKKKNAQGGFLSEKAASQNPFSMEDPNGFYQRSLKEIDAFEQLKIYGKDDAEKARIALTKTTAFAAAQGLLQADAETYQALRSGAIVPFSKNPEENTKMNEEAKRVLANLDGSQALQLDRQAQRTIEHRDTMARSAETFQEKKDEKIRKTITGPFMAKVWEDAMKPGADIRSLMDQAFQAGPNGVGLPGPDGSPNVKLTETELNHMRTTLGAIAKEGALKSDVSTLSDFYVDLDKDQRYNPTDYSRAYEGGKLTTANFTALVSAWHARRLSDHSEAKAELREARSENRRHMSKFFDVEGITEVFTEERKRLYLQADGEWIAKSSGTRDPYQLDQIRRDIEDKYEPMLKAKIREEVSKAGVYTNGYQTLAELEADKAKGHVRGINVTNPREYADLVSKVRRYEGLVQKENEKKATEAQQARDKANSPSSSNPIRRLFGGSK